MKSVSLLSVDDGAAYCTYLQSTKVSNPKESEDEISILRLPNAAGADDKEEDDAPPPMPLGFRSFESSCPPSPTSSSVNSEFACRTAKKEICVWFLNGNCRFGSRCRNSHGNDCDQSYDAELSFRSRRSKPYEPCPYSPISSIGSESDFEEDSHSVSDEEFDNRASGLYVAVNGKLQFVPDIKTSDPDLLVCWDFNTQFGCTYPGCTWEHRPCNTIKAHPTKFGRICSPEHGLRNMRDENNKLMKHQKEKMMNLGFL